MAIKLPPTTRGADTGRGSEVTILRETPLHGNSGCKRKLLSRASARTRGKEGHSVSWRPEGDSGGPTSKSMAPRGGPAHSWSGKDVIVTQV